MQNLLIKEKPECNCYLNSIFTEALVELQE
jgi:hypothetical protein